MIDDHVRNVIPTRCTVIIVGDEMTIVALCARIELSVLTSGHDQSRGCLARTVQTNHTRQNMHIDDPGMRVAAGGKVVRGPFKRITL